MGQLILKGDLKLLGSLDLKDKVMVDTAEALVELPASDAQGHGTGAPVMQPPPPAGPINTGPKVVVVSSFNKTITAGGKAIITMGMAMQGEPPLWPGLVTPSTNSGVQANGLAIAVVGDKAQIFPSGASAPLSQSGQ